MRMPAFIGRCFCREEKAFIVQSMNSPQNREETIFEAALQLPPEQRAAHVKEACGDDGRFADASNCSSSRTSRPAAFPGETAAPWARRKPWVCLPPPVEELLGTMIGRYKLLEKIGEGGFGVVYMAEQREPVKRRVALKIIKLGMDTKQVVARFEAERQALAMMDHPNIAKVFDAGATETGRPYFVMELVRGIRITEYCDQNNLPTRRAARTVHPGLPGDPARAPEGNHPSRHQALEHSGHAARRRAGAEGDRFRHRQGDAGRADGARRFTRSSQQFIGTPAYMSPGAGRDERAGHRHAQRHLQPGRAALRTADRPNALRREGTAAMRAWMRCGGSSGRRSRRGLRRALSTLQGDERTVDRQSVADWKRPNWFICCSGDLDWIVMKCLEKDRTRRYETANGLAMDLQRHLSNEPVIARPPSAVYRLQKVRATQQAGLCGGISGGGRIVSGCDREHLAGGARHTGATDRRPRTGQVKTEASSRRRQRGRRGASSVRRLKRLASGQNRLFPKRWKSKPTVLVREGGSPKPSPISPALCA